MTVFLNVLGAAAKADALAKVVRGLREGQLSPSVFDVDPTIFLDIPTSAFAYWTTDSLRNAFRSLPRFQYGRRHACITNPAGDDNRYLRLWWEPVGDRPGLLEWKPISKGGTFSPYYYDVHLLVAWSPTRQTYLGFVGTRHRPMERPASLEYFFRPGITWPSRTQRLSPRLMPSGSVFSGKGPAAFDDEDNVQHLLAMCALMNSRPFAALVATRLNATDAQARSYEVGTIQQTPFPDLVEGDLADLAGLALKQWKLRQLMDQAVETSHAFVLPGTLLQRLRPDYKSSYDVELSDLQQAIEKAAFRIYRVGPEDCAEGPIDVTPVRASVEEADEDEDGPEDPAKTSGAGDVLLMSWAVGVAFGRFDWRLAIGQLDAPPVPEPLDSLSRRSPGMLPEDSAPFFVNFGVLVDDAGHPHDLVRVMDEVLACVDASVPNDLRRWLQKDFFPFHLQRYSKSRRKAPIYWPLSTGSGSYNLWIYYPSLSSQTLYNAVNDFVEPKLRQVGGDVALLRNRGAARTREDEKQFEALQAFELELIELRDCLLKLAPTYKPNHEDGVQISAAPLWPLFRYRPWQKLLKESWTKLEKGDYDWSHLAMNYWPDRVREKCKADKSLAIAHGLESLYVELEAAPNKTRGRKKGLEE